MIYCTWCGRVGTCAPRCPYRLAETEGGGSGVGAGSKQAQLNPNDDLGWLVDRMADPDPGRRLCPKACARAKASLLSLRSNMRTAADRDRVLTAENDDLHAACAKALAVLRVV